MAPISRRSLLLSATASALLKAQNASLTALLTDGARKHKIPSAVAMVASSDKILYSNAFGKRDSTATSPLTVDAIFGIASMTKAITTTAALQQVEQGKVTLDEPVAKYLPALARLQVLQGFNAQGKPNLKPATKPVTLRHLLTHTSGFCYTYWDKQMFEYQSKAGAPPAGSDPYLTPLMFEPGTRWQYGPSIDWAGRLVEALSGLTLEDYFQKHILGPLRMKDTSYILKPAKFDRLVSSWSRKSPGSPLVEDQRQMPETPKVFNGGGGLYSTAADYVQFMQMILKRGIGPGGVRVLEAKTVDLMSANQTGALQAGKMASFRQTFSMDVDLHPGESDRYTFGFLLNPKAYPGGRSANSLAWAGLFNTYYWIDPSKDRCAVLLMQMLPFADTEGLALLSEFEHGVYS